MKQTFDVTGMTCAACSARVEKATAKVDGVESVAVNLLKNRMDVTYDGSPEIQQAICDAVAKAGYGAFPRVNAGDSNASAPSGRTVSTSAPVTDAAAEAKKVKFRLIISFIFTIPLFYLSMGHMMGWPLPSIFLGHENMMIFAFTQFLLLLPVIFVNFKFFRIGFTDSFAMPENPLAYCVASPQIIHFIEPLMKMPDSIKLAYSVAKEALNLSAYLDNTRELLDSEIPWMQYKLSLIPGLTIYPAEANYVLCCYNPGSALSLGVNNTQELIAHLQERGFLVRALEHTPGLPPASYFCIAVKSRKQNDQLIAAMRAIICSA